MHSTLRASVFLLAAVAAFAQSDRGTITGTVTDPAGAVVPNASLEAKNVQTGAVYQAASTQTGNYTIAELPVGQYTLTATAAGFKKYSHENLTVPAAQTIRVDVALQVGSASESVTVSAEASLLKTESGEMSHNVNVERLDELPILGTGSSQAGSSGIRNPYAVTQLVPGALWTANNTVRINGAPGNSQALRIEGQDATLGFANWASQESQPSVDAIEEFAVQTSNYAAEFGQAGGGLFNVTMKSGTNDFHGTAYDYFVNEALNAGQPFTNDGKGHLLRPVARHNDYGFTVGGPVWIPKVYNGHDKTFFFFNWEQYLESNFINNQFLTVPTDAYRNGDFSGLLTGRTLTDSLGNKIPEGTIFDPATNTPLPNGQITRSPFPGNQSPVSRMDPVALKIQSLIPTAAMPGVINNLIRPYSSDRTTSIPALKLDQLVGSKQKISFYWQRTGTSSQFSPALGQSDGLPLPITAARGTFIYNHTERLNYDYTLSPTLLLHLGAGFQHNSFNDDAPVLDFDPVTQLGIPGPTTPRNFPTILGLTGTLGGGPNMGPNGQTTSLMIKPTSVASLTWVRGNHTYKFGGEFRTEGYPNINHSRIDGQYTFSPAETGLPYLNSNTLGGGNVGFSYASFLLGLVDQANIATISNPRLGKKEAAFFLQDTWKVTRKLTLDYGLRWDYGTYQRETFGRFPEFSATTPNPSAGGHPGGVIFDGSGPGRCDCNFAKNYPWAFGPRLGVAYQFLPKTVLRVGAGITYDATAGNNQVTGAASSQNPIQGSAFGTPAMTLSAGIPRTADQIAWPNFSPGLYPALPGNIAAFPTDLVDPNAGRPARQWMWSIGIQRELTPDLMVEAAYVGNRGNWWQANSLLDYNAVTSQILGAHNLNVNNPADVTLLTTPLSAVLGTTNATAHNLGLPYQGFPTNATVAQSLRPFPQFTNINALWAPLGDTWYDSLQVKVTKRFSHGLTANYSFSWQKELTLGVESDPPGPGAPPAAINDVFNREANKTISGYSRPLTSILSVNYTTPKFAASSGLMKAASWLARDWQIGALLQYASGLPIHVPYAQSTPLLSSVLERNLPLGVTNTTFANRVPGQPLFLQDLNCHCFDPTKTLALNPAAWADPAAGQFGTSAPYYNDYRYQRRPGENMNLARIFRLTERVNLELRAEFVNIFNRTEVANPVATNASAATVVNPTTGLLTSGFGFINTATTVIAPRQGTIIARFRF